MFLPTRSHKIPHEIKWRKQHWTLVNYRYQPSRPPGVSMCNRHSATTVTLQSLCYVVEDVLLLFFSSSTSIWTSGSPPILWTRSCLQGSSSKWKSEPDGQFSHKDVASQLQSITSSLINHKTHENSKHVRIGRNCGFRADGSSVGTKPWIIVQQAWLDRSTCDV